MLSGGLDSSIILARLKDAPAEAFDGLFELLLDR